METSVFPQQQGGKSSAWNDPAKRIGMIFGAILFGVVGFFVLPYLTTILTNWIHFTVALCVFSALFYILVVDRRIYLALKYMYDWFIKTFFGMIFRLDPFLIAEDCIQDIRNERATLEQQIVAVSGQREETLATIKENKVEMNSQLDIAAAALKKNMPGEMGVASAQAKRLDQFVLRLEPIEKNLNDIEVYLEAVHKNSGYMLQDMENELKIKKAEYKAVTKGNSALNTALAAMKGNPTKRKLMEDSMDYLKEDMANKLANMKYAIRQSSSVMKTIDLTNATMETEGLRMLQQYKPELFALDRGQEAPALTTAANNATKPITKYDNLLN